MQTQYYRSETDKMIGGVCGGLGRSLGIDPIYLRLFFVLLAIGKGAGVLIYIILWVIMPSEAQVTGSTSDSEGGSLTTDDIAERARAMGDDLREAVSRPNPQIGMILGIVLILLGAVFFIDNLNINWLWWFDFDILWPLLLVLGGGVLLYRQWRGV